MSGVIFIIGKYKKSFWAGKKKGENVKFINFSKSSF